MSELQEMSVKLTCPRCGSRVVWKNGLRPSVKLGKKKQRYLCGQCGHTFNECL